MKFRLTTRDDLHLPYYSHSIAEAIVTCPKWGIIRYVERKYFKAQYRAMALEAGSAMHDVFAVARLCQLAWKQMLPHIAYREAKRLFPQTYDTIFYDLEEIPEQHKFRDAVLERTFKSLQVGDFYDDPNDQVRTLANLEISSIRLVDELIHTMDRNEVFVSDDPDTSVVGVEQSFDFVVDETFRFIGTMDGLSNHVSYDAIDAYIRLEELKTASRLDEAFRESWRVKSQPVGYIIAARLLTGIQEINKVRMLGIKVKQTRGHEDFLSFEEERDHGRIIEWYNTLMFVHYIVERFKADPLSAPQFTHSCNRYFRPCGFVDLCGADYDDQQLIYESMEETPLSPSEASILEKWK